MRILSVRFKNLNSLYGEWEIDFTRPEYTAEGIFAITGPTGAGKSTILDAICLALYGRTPRLAAINKSGNDIMSRHTRECFAEVHFSVASGEYRCNWSQHRAKKSGELQQHRHEIAEAASSVILEDKVRPVAEKVIALTGMDFEQFTRSVLLAQGGFAAFLEASPKNRAPLLEQITGTEVYSEVSRYCHERKTLEHAALQQLRAELGTMTPLLPEEEEELKNTLEQLAAQEKTLLTQREENTRKLGWLSQLAGLRRDMQDITTRRHGVAERMLLFEPQKIRLQLARKAQSLEADLAALTMLRAELLAARQERAALEQQIPALRAFLAEAKNTCALAEQKALSLRGERKSFIALLADVRALDLCIGEKTASLAEQSAALRETEKNVLTLHRDLAALEQQIETAKEDIRLLGESLGPTAADAALVHEYTGFTTRLAALEQALGTRRTAGEAMQGAQKECERAHQAHAAAEQRFRQEEDACQSAQKARMRSEEALAALLAGRDAAFYRASAASLAAERDTIAKAEKAAALFHAHTKALGKLRSAAAQIQNDLAAQENETTNLHATEQALEQQAAEAERAAARLRLEDRLAELRATLEPDETCPLCGSKEHPFLSGVVPDAPPQPTENAGQDISETGKALAETRRKITELAASRAALARDLVHAASEESRLEASLTEARAALEASGLAPSPDVANKLADKAAAIDESLHATETLIRKVEFLEKELAQSQGLLTKSAQKLQAAQNALHEAAHARDMQELRLSQTKSDFAKSDDQAALLREQLLDALRPFTPALAKDDDLGATLCLLDERRREWLHREQRFKEMEQSQKVFAERQTLLKERIQSEETLLGRQKTACSLTTAELEPLRAKRLALFAEQSPDRAEARFTEDLDQAEKQLQACKDALALAYMRHTQALDKMADADTTLTRRGQAALAAEQSFMEKLLACGFADEAAFTAARLDEGSIRTLVEQEEALHKEHVETDSLLREKKAALSALEEQRLTDQSAEELESLGRELLVSEKTLQQQTGAARQRLAHNEEQKRLMADRLLAVAAQTKECQRWDNLHALIGSADGSKFRTFAQGLTFALLISHANKQLVKLSDRYLLVRDADEPLELSVIDNYQAGEARSIKNLSGGESFIVSLSLALGLAQMAGTGMQVDSLFLDEGFGTLDEDSLDTALETLAGLQQHGKTIGIISHVAALKDRISTKIQVIPGNGGKSSLTGPGCRRPDQPE